MGLPLRSAFRETPTVRVSRHGEAGEDLLFVLGWGNDPDHEHVSWLVGELVAAGYRVHAVTLPTNGWDFDAQYLAPVRDYAVARRFDVVLSHSTGGLVAAHLDLPARNVFLSPWWGTSPAGWFESLIFPVFRRLPTARRLYMPDRDVSAIGDLKSEAEFQAGPDGISPAFLSTILDAQERLGAFDESDVVFYTPTDEVVSPAAVEERTPARNRRPYDGGHEFFASSGRGAVLDDVLAAIDRGPAAVASTDDDGVGDESTRA
jgi:hypothetical protein